MKQPKKRPVQAADAADSIDDSPEYLATWAKTLVRAVGKREARLALAEYKRLAADPNVTERGREIAAQRAKILSTLV